MAAKFAGTDVWTRIGVAENSVGGQLQEWNHPRNRVETILIGGLQHDLASNNENHILKCWYQDRYPTIGDRPPRKRRRVSALSPTLLNDVPDEVRRLNPTAFRRAAKTFFCVCVGGGGVFVCVGVHESDISP